jgi:hypothetical protein
MDNDGPIVGNFESFSQILSGGTSTCIKQLMTSAVTLCTTDAGYEQIRS